MPSKGMILFPGRTADEDIALDMVRYMEHQGLNAETQAILEPYPLAQWISESFAYFYNSERKDTLDLRQQKPEIFAAVYSSMFAVYPAEVRTPQKLLEAAISGFPKDIRSAIEDNILVSSIKGLMYYETKYGSPSNLHMPPAAHGNYTRLIDPVFAAGLADGSKIACPYVFSESFQQGIKNVQLTINNDLLPGHIWITQP